jgi:hypothetical protein
VDWIAWVRSQDDVAGGSDRLCKIGEAFLAAQRDDDFAVGIERDVETALVICCLSLAQSGNAPRGRIAMSGRLCSDFGKLGDDVGRRRAVGVAHAKIDDVLAPAARGGLHRIDLREDIGRQAADAVEVVGHGRIVAAMLHRINIRSS